MITLRPATRPGRIIRAFFTFYLFLTACGPGQIQPTNRPTPTIPPTPTMIVARNLVGGFVGAFSVPELEKKAPLIVIGTVTQIGEIFNASRDPYDPSKPNSDLFGIARLYGLTVERFVKGKELAGGDDTIFVSQPEGEIFGIPSASITDKDIEQALSQTDYNPFILGRRYLLFLREAKYPLELPKNYAGAAPLWRFLIYEGCVFMETAGMSFGESITYIGPNDLEGFIALIEQSMLSEAPAPKAETIYPTESAASMQCHLYPGSGYAKPTPIQADSGTPYP